MCPPPPYRPSIHLSARLPFRPRQPDLPVDRKREFVEALEAYREELKVRATVAVDGHTSP